MESIYASKKGACFSMERVTKERRKWCSEALHLIFYHAFNCRLLNKINALRCSYLDSIQFLGYIGVAECPLRHSLEALYYGGNVCLERSNSWCLAYACCKVNCPGDCMLAMKSVTCCWCFTHANHCASSLVDLRSLCCIEIVVIFGYLDASVGGLQ